MSKDWNRTQRILEQRGLNNADGIRRTVTARACRKCHAPLLAGLSGDIAAIAAVCDPAPLSALGEALAVLGGRYTCTLCWAGDRYELDLRDSFHMRTPAGTGRADVLAEHRCGVPLPTVPSVLTQRTPAPKETTCPY